MSDYFFEAGHSFIVSEVNKDKVIDWLTNDDIYDYNSSPHKIKVIETGDGKYILDPDDPPFNCEWCSSGPSEEVRELLSMCEDGSYLSLWCDVYMEYALYWKEDGVINEDWKCIENPFTPVMDRLYEQALGIFKR